MRDLLQAILDEARAPHVNPEHALRQIGDMVEKALNDPSIYVSGCPFDHPNELDETDPCPVCGGLGTPDAENKCPYPRNRIPR